MHSAFIDNYSFGIGAVDKSKTSGIQDIQSRYIRSEYFPVDGDGFDTNAPF